MSDTAAAFPLVGHGASRLPAVDVDSYNVEIKDAQGFLGDRANKGAFRSILHEWRKRTRLAGEDPLGGVDTDDISQKQLEKILNGSDMEAAGIVQSAIEDFAQELSMVVRRFLKLSAWRETERLVFGGGFRDGRIGEMSIARTGALLKAAELAVEVVSIRHDPDEAGLLGAVHLAPSWIFKGHDAILAVDIGGTNMRAGVVVLNLKQAPDLSKASVRNSKLWRHADEKVNRDGAVKRLSAILEDLIKDSKKQKLALAPFIGIGCPGIIEPDGSIKRGAQNLPGNWESSKFDLPTVLRRNIPLIGKLDTHVVMHNDAVVQGLSEVPFMQDVESWGIFTIGTGLGNAHFVNRKNNK
jgi:hypothetical protein